MSLKILVKLGLFPKSANQLGKQNVQKVGGRGPLWRTKYTTRYLTGSQYSADSLWVGLFTRQGRISQGSTRAVSQYSVRGWVTDKLSSGPKSIQNWLWPQPLPPRSPPHCQIGRFFKPYFIISWFKAKVNHYCAQNTLARVLTPNNALSNIDKKWPKPFGQAFTPPPLTLSQTCNAHTDVL